MKYYLFLLLVVLLCISCSSLKHTSKVQASLPELGTIGIYESYLLGTNYQPKAILTLSEAVKVQLEKIQIEPRQIFQKKDSLKQVVRDSIHLRLAISDKLSVINEVNADGKLLNYLKGTNDNRLVSSIKVFFPDATLNQLLAAEEIYLIQNRQKTLSLELRTGNRKTGQIEFSEGTILSIQTSEFCWGQNDRRKIEIFDLVPTGSECSGNTYKSIKKVKKKNEFKF